MSTDYSLLRRSEPRLSKEEEESGPVGEPLGSRDQVLRGLQSCSSIQWSEDNEGWITSPDFNLRVAISGDSTHVTGLFVSTSEPDFAIHAIAEICAAMNLEIFDHQQGEFINRSALEFYPLEEDIDGDDEEDEDLSESIRRPQVKEIVYHAKTG